jgi:4-hydroxy-4-methyl-2-oxoglutarate aldolase
VSAAALAALGVATVYEASGREGLVDAELVQVVPGSRVAGALQARVRGIAGLLIDAAVRDRDQLADLGLPIWARWIRAAGADKQLPGKLDTTVVVGGQRIAPGDYVVMNEAAMRERLAAGELTLGLLGLRPCSR